jgi:hypothetical protein
MLDVKQTERTKTSEVSKLCRVIRHSSYEPVGSRLPHGIENTAKCVQYDSACVAMIEDIHLRGSWRDRLASVLSGMRELINTF